MINGFNTWRIATATQMHFNSEGYDAFRFKFKAKNLTPASFEKRSDKYFFEKLANTYENPEVIKRFAFANIYFNGVSWAGSMTNEPYKDYIKRMQSFSYKFKEDLQSLPSKSLDELLSPINGNIPNIISMNTMKETIIAIHCVTNFLNTVHSKVNDTLLWPELRKGYIKATPFIAMDINQKKIKKMLIEHFSGVQSTTNGV